jgi:Na+-translocating ferredoxin:NAD+ oxidoreductase subunit G
VSGHGSAPQGANGASTAGTAGGPGGRRDWVRIAASMTVTCAIGAALLGGVYLATERYAEEARARGERRAIADLLGLGEKAEVRAVAQYLTRDRAAVVYRAASAAGEAVPRELVFTLDGSLVRDAAARTAEPEEGLVPLGRIFVVRHEGVPAGFVVEGESRGYKNRIRFFVGLTPSWEIAGVRVVEHEEDPGLGAEVATPWFQEQYAGRPLAGVPALDVTRDPMPEDWREALRATPRSTVDAWNARHGKLRDRERSRPIYAVTGATISSRALTDGVRATILHFRRRWDLLAPYLEEGR